MPKWTAVQHASLFKRRVDSKGRVFTKGHQGVIGKNFAARLKDITKVKGYFVETLELHFILASYPEKGALWDCTGLHCTVVGTKQLAPPQTPEMWVYSSGMSLEVVYRRIMPTIMIFKEKVGAGGRNYFLSTGDKVMTFLGSNSEFLLGRKLKIWSVATNCGRAARLFCTRGVY